MALDEKAEMGLPWSHLSDVLPERLDPTAQALEARSGTHARIAPARASEGWACALLRNGSCFSATTRFGEKGDLTQTPNI